MGTFQLDSFRATKKDIQSDVLNFRAIDGARTRGLDLGKVARYQLRHHRIYLCRLLLPATMNTILESGSKVKHFLKNFKFAKLEARQ